MTTAKEGVLHIMSRDGFHEPVKAQYSLDNGAGYLITCKVISREGERKIAGLKKKQKKIKGF